MTITKGFWRTEDGVKAEVLDVRHGFAIGWVNDYAHTWTEGGVSISMSMFNLVARISESVGVASSVGTIMLQGVTTPINDEHERNEFARAALIGILACDGRPDGDDAKVEWAFTLADKMILRSKVKP